MLERDTVRLPNGRTWQVYAGGKGPELIWLHGIRGVEANDPLLLKLAERHRVTAPVAPGFTDLDEMNDIDDVRDMALAYDDLLRHLGLKAPTLVGHSFGGMIAAELAAHVPDSVARLGLIAPFGLWTDAAPVADIFAVAAPDMDQLLWHDVAARDAFQARLAALPEANDEVERVVGAARRLTAVAKFLWPIPDKGLRRRLPRIAAPTLLLFGREDAVIPKRYAEEFASGLRQVQTAVVDGAGHMLPYEKPDHVVQQIGQFVTSASR
jgi:pimeloyl-ACP methyl ester carboxylesterase